MVKGFRNGLSASFRGSLSSALVAMFRDGRRRKSKTPPRNMHAEACESRVLLSATELTGTAGNDVFTLTYDGAANGNVDVSIATNGGASTSMGTFSMASGLSLQGLGGTDTVRVEGTSGADVYAVSAGNLTINGSQLLLASVENRTLAGLSGNDTYHFDADSQLGTVTIDDSSGGRDLLDFSQTTTTTVRVNLSVGTQQVVNSNLRLALSSDNTIEDVTGGAGDDVLLGNALDNRFQGGAGHDYMNGYAGSDILFGGDGNDIYAFTAASSLEADSILESTATTGGRDELRFTTLNTSVIVDLSSTATQSVHLNRTLRINSGVAFETVYGGSTHDSLTGNSLDNILVGGGGSDSLRGLAGNDTYAFGATTSAESDAVIEAAGGGVDLITFASVTANVYVNLGITTNQVVHPNRVLRLSAGNVIENLTGGSGNDTLIGNALSNVLRGGAGDEVLWGRAGNDWLIGGTGDDIYDFETAASAELDTIYELTGEGSDTAQFSSISTDVAFSLAASGTQTVHTNRQVILSGTGSVENITGGSGSDTLTGNASANILIGGAGNDLLKGGAGNDIYKFTAAFSAEVDTLVELSSAGSDTLDFSSLTTAVMVDLSLSTSQTVHTNRQVVLQSPLNFEKVIGGTASDRLTGNAAANILVGGAGNDVLTGAAGSDSLEGGTGDDTYLLGGAASLETDSIVEVSGAGLDILNFATVTTSVNISLGTTALQTVHTNRRLTFSDAAAVEGVVGGSGNDRLTGNSLNNSLLGNAGHDTLIGLGGSDVLQGGIGNDTYVLTSASATETDTIGEWADGGIDTLDFSSLSVNVAVNLGTTQTQTVHTHRNVRLTSALDFEIVLSGSGDDTLTGNAADNSFSAGTGDDSMLGLGGNDYYYFGTATSAEVDRVTEVDDAGIDTLSFNAIATGVTVNLGATTTQTIHTNRQLILSSGTSVENVIGGSGEDTITGNVHSNVLVGNAGNDLLIGLQGRDILIGGLGADDLLGGTEDDILIAGRTTSDLRIGSLLALQAKWESANSYSQRIQNLLAGVGSPSVSLEAQINVLNDNGADDELTGGAGSDWYFRAVDDVITDLLASEQIDGL